MKIFVVWFATIGFILILFSGIINGTLLTNSSDKNSNPTVNDVQSEIKKLIESRYPNVTSRMRESGYNGLILYGSKKYQFDGCRVQIMGNSGDSISFDGSKITTIKTFGARNGKWVGGYIPTAIAIVVSNIHSDSSTFHEVIRVDTDNSQFFDSLKFYFVSLMNLC